MAKPGLVATASLIPWTSLPPEYYPHGRDYLLWGIYYVYGNQFGPTCAAGLEFPFGWTWADPFLVPLSLMALAIGVFAARNVFAPKALSSQLYALSLFSYGLMMTSAMFADSLLGGFMVEKPHDASSWAKFIFGWIDMTLTSSIAVSLAFNGLSDLGLLDEDSRKARSVMALTYATIGAAWLWALWTLWELSFFVLYVGIVILGCATFLIAELVYLCRASSTSRGIAFLMACGMFGFAGLAMLFLYPPSLCVLLTPLFGNNEWWFLLANCAIWCLYRYYVMNRCPPRRFTPRSTMGRISAASASSVELEQLNKSESTSA